MHARGLCEHHYYKARASGILALKIYPVVCTVPDCDAPHHALGVCFVHYHRLRQHGSTELKRKITTYKAAHRQLRRKRGKASELQCLNTSCSSLATDWCYDYTNASECVIEMKNGNPLKYSTNIADYIPLCRRCHRKFDKKDVVGDIDVILPERGRR
jgi:hypothetical protein